MSSPSPPIALVTAGSAGLGACVAELFARNGMRVVINYASNVQRADELVAKLKSISTLAPAEGRVDYHAIKADLASRADVERLVEEAVDAMCPARGAEGSGNGKRRLDVVFSNGGWTHMRNLYDLEDNMVDEDWDRCFTVNVKSHLWLMHAAKPYLSAGWDDEEGGAKESGCFVTTASLAGVKVSGSSLAYAVTKAAHLHLAKALAMLAAPKVRVNSVSPGLLLTEWGLRFPPERIQAMTEASKLKRLAAVEDVAEQVLTFVKNKSVTGQNMVLDGGLSL
ncbi:short chain dehydrogenase [Diaporthe eres]|uniref:Short chain dehydrogenase n=1 Tax=Diaporthe vaccinii TaxID=105482 RepID=A0ABR4EQ87_9PEZI|nr:short chain dehydrogenase [Diaporthe eres]